MELKRLAKNRYLQLSIKLLFGLAVVVFISWKIYGVFLENDFQCIAWGEEVGYLIGVSFGLMFLNWSIEAVKWKVLMEEVNPLSFGKALVGVLAGISTGIITPNRLGNFVGRTLLIDRKYRLRAILLTLIANLAQFTVTVFFGVVGVLLIGATLFQCSLFLLLPITLLALYFALRIFIHPRLVNRRPFNYFFTEKVEEGIDFISDTRLILKWRIIALSAARYLVFCSQYVLLLMALNQDHEWYVLWPHVMVVYVLMTLIPSLFFGKLFVREAAALLVFAAIGVPDAVILLTGFFLWLINIAIPALVGAGLLLGKK